MNKVFYRIGKLSPEKEYELDFKDALSRSVEERIALGFVPLKLSVFDDAAYRVFDSMKEYRNWAKENLPSWLGYDRADD